MIKSRLIQLLLELVEVIRVGHELQAYAQRTYIEIKVIHYLNASIDLKRQWLLTFERIRRPYPCGRIQCKPAGRELKRQANATSTGR